MSSVHVWDLPNFFLFLYLGDTTNGLLLQWVFVSLTFKDYLMFLSIDTNVDIVFHFYSWLHNSGASGGKR